MASRKCSICGHIENEFVYFCTKCGAKTVENALIVPTGQEEYVSDQSTNYQQENVQQVEIPSAETKLSKGKNSNKINPIILIMGVVIVVLIIVIAALVSRKEPDNSVMSANNESGEQNNSAEKEINEREINNNPVANKTDSNLIENNDTFKYADSGLDYEDDYQENKYTEKVNRDFEIYSGIREDYENALDPGYYQYYNSGISDFSFWYPNNLYCDVFSAENIDCEYGYLRKEVTFYGSEGSTLTYRLIQRNDSLSLEDATENVHSVETMALYEAEDIVNGTTSDHGKVIVTGWDSSAHNYAIYDLYKIEDDYLLQMKVVFPDYTSDLDRLQKAYVTECYYRLCGFSDSKAETRSYSEFMENN